MYPVVIRLTFSPRDPCLNNNSKKSSTNEELMTRSLQSASLSFGLANIPVKLYTAAISKSVSSHLLHEKDQSRISEQFVWIAEDKSVTREDLAKDYEMSPGNYVTLRAQELKALEAEAKPQCRSPGL
jgi:non-homologous end joining protein Ku